MSEHEALGVQGKLKDKFDAVIDGMRETGKRLDLRKHKVQRALLGACDSKAEMATVAEYLMVNHEVPAGKIIDAVARANRKFVATHGQRHGFYSVQPVTA